MSAFKTLIASLSILCFQSIFMLSCPAAEVESRIYRSSNVSLYSSGLGVGMIPAFVQKDGKRWSGLYTTETPEAGSLAYRIGLKRSALLLTLDGYSINTVAAADNWLRRRPFGSLKYTFLLVKNGKPLFYSGEISSSELAFQSSASADAVQESQASREYSIEELERYDLSLINESRKREGSAPISADPSLGRLAREYAEYMLKHPEKYVILKDNPHMDLLGRPPMARARDAGIMREVHENLNMQSRGAMDDMKLISRMHETMMAEPPGQHNHRSILLDPRAQAVGVGVSRQGSLLYMVEEYGH